MYKVIHWTKYFGCPFTSEKQCNVHKWSFIKRYRKSCFKNSWSENKSKGSSLLIKTTKKNTIASKRYKGLINARIPSKRNNNEKITHEDFHFTCSQVNLVNEMAYLCKENTLSLSVDNKNKVEVGIPATSRRSQIRTFYLCKDYGTR